jgi:type IV pilus assembly protein PilQ
VRWGFNYIADRAFGNQTGFSFPRSIDSDYAVNLPASGSNGTLGLSFRNILNTFALDLSLQALESRGKARVISRPMVMVQNNQPATISSGFQIPITNTTATETDVTFVPATLSLSVTPQITADDNVIMDIDVHNDTPGFLVGSNPSIATRNATTVVAVPDGGTTVIGGIYQVNEGTSSGRVPFMSRIPLLGWLFRNKSVSRTNDELLIFLTPRIQKTN